ncbi:response regulator [Paracoccus benzoatiresistens]|uniref:Response regulator n=1 Tax=Paracoccus benzoatiresistens TaxID=2997341 RepID=A0ABT4JBA8_9RHOB|nr:response regulator [Paracoccus sp. EF6]MCZ0964363.1 response regulator [Paracoccus sp. EF6]
MTGKTSESSDGDSRPVVLVVEDEFMVALDIQAMLKGNGYRALGPASSVDAALRLLAHEQPDLAVLDVNLHGQPVVPVAKRLRSLQIPFVIASAYGSFDFEDSEVLAEVENVEKPFTERQLLAAMRRLEATG